MYGSSSVGNNSQQQNLSLLASQHVAQQQLQQQRSLPPYSGPSMSNLRDVHGSSADQIMNLIRDNIPALGSAPSVTTSQPQQPGPSRHIQQELFNSVGGPAVFQQQGLQYQPQQQIGNYQQPYGQQQSQSQSGINPSLQLQQLLLGLQQQQPQQPSLHQQQPQQPTQQQQQQFMGAPWQQQGDDLLMRQELDRLRQELAQSRQSQQQQHLVHQQQHTSVDVNGGPAAFLQSLATMFNPLSDGQLGLGGPLGATKGRSSMKTTRPADFAKQCKVLYASKAKNTDINMNLYCYGFMATLLAARQGRIQMSEDEYTARMHHFMNVMETAALHSKVEDFQQYGWVVARDYDNKVMADIERGSTSWTQLGQSIDSGNFAMAVAANPRPTVGKQGVSSNKQGEKKLENKVLVCNSFNQTEDDGCSYEF